MYWSTRTYSKYSPRVALSTVTDYVAAAAERSHPAIAITDKGTLSGTVELYKSARKHGIAPVPGIELPIIVDKASLKPVGGTLTLLATTMTGYRNLCLLTRVAYAHNKTGAVDFGDLAAAAETGILDGIACLTGAPGTGLLDSLLTHAHPPSARTVLAALAGWFGGGTWVELSPIPGADTDSAVMAQNLAYALASSIGLGCITTIGPRYLAAKDRHAWETLNEINTGTYEHVQATHPLHFADADEIRPWFTVQHWESSIAALADLAAAAQVRIPELDTFSIAVPDVSAPKDPDADLMDRVGAAIAERLSDGRIPAAREREYYQRMNEELEIVFDAGFSGYLLFTATVTDWITGHGILHNTRGSAVASLLCWLLGITRIDPLTWDLPFDQFLSRDRAKPPDVDIDVDADRRQEVVDWLSASFPVLRIATFAEGHASDTSPVTGSLAVKYTAMLRRTGQYNADPLGDATDSRLRALSKYQPYMSVGVNAAGFIVTPDEASLNGIPVIGIESSDTLVSGYDKYDIEALGYVKLDVLPLITLSALDKIAASTGVSWDVPLDDKDVYASICTGKTGGLFQLEGRALTIGIKRLKPNKMSDLVAAVALFRPATMKSGGTEQYLQRRFRRQRTPKRHPIIEKHVSETYGVLLYQEQAISLLRDIGLTTDEIEEARKAIKASNAAVDDAKQDMKRVVRKAMDLGTALGMDTEDLAWIAEAVQAYADYGFKKAHAVSYAYVSYLTAWYKKYYPLHFWAAFLTVYTGKDQEKRYLKEIRESGIDVRGPHVNTSAAAYTITGSSLRKSLTSIKGVGAKAAAELTAKAPYTSLQDLASRVDHQKVSGAKSLIEGHSPASCGGVIAALHEANALAGLP